MVVELELLLAGGGGATAVGGNAANGTGGAGGAGAPNAITGTATSYAGGGGGGGDYLRTLVEVLVVVELEKVDQVETPELVEQQTQVVVVAELFKSPPSTFQRRSRWFRYRDRKSKRRSRSYISNNSRWFSFLCSKWFKFDQIASFTASGCLTISDGDPCCSSKLFSSRWWWRWWLNRGGGGGAGGYRTSYWPAPYKVTLLAAGDHSITVGAGGAGSSAGNSNAHGSDSVFSNITSAGGGKVEWWTEQCWITGGSGGGGGGDGGEPRSTGGAGNTPPTDPSQGNTGGPRIGPYGAGGGGGGAGATLEDAHFKQLVLVVMVEQVAPIYKSVLLHSRWWCGGMQ